MPQWIRRFAFGSLIVTGLLIVVAIPILAKLFVPGEGWIGVLGLIPGLGGIVALRFERAGRSMRALTATACTACLMSPAIFALAADRIDDHRQVERMVNLFYGDADPSNIDLISFSSTEASWVFYAGQPIERLLEPELAIEALFAVNEQGQSRALVTTGRRYETLRPHLKSKAVEVESMPYFLESDTIVVVRPTNTVQVADKPYRAVR